MLAARAQHVAEVIEPALARGDDVVCDRYSGSTLAYQGYGRGLDVDELRELDSWANGHRVPDLVVLLDLPVEIARERLGWEPPRPDRKRGRRLLDESPCRLSSPCRARTLCAGGWSTLRGPSKKWPLL